jgi:hypothetical protein
MKHKYICVHKTRGLIQVRIQRKNAIIKHYFYVKEYDTLEQCIEEAIKWRDEQLERVGKTVTRKGEPTNGNDAWASLSKHPKPRATSQILLWGVTKKAVQHMENDHVQS